MAQQGALSVRRNLDWICSNCPKVFVFVPVDLQDEEAEEVEVGGALELLEQVEGEEGEQGVLGRLDEVVLEQELQ